MLAVNKSIDLNISGTNKGVDGPLSDHELWRAFRAGNAEAYAMIYKQYFFPLFSYGKKFSPNEELVKDAIQEVFIKIWNNRENLGDTTSIKFYLFTALKRKLFDILKTPEMQRVDFIGDSETVHETADHEREDDGDIFQKEKVLNALSRLSAHQQKLINMKFYRNLSSQEMSDELGIGTQSVYNAVFKALKKLRNHLSAGAWILLACI